MVSRLAILFSACISFCAYGLAQVYPFVNYTPRDGLVGNKIRFITQDSKGRMYFGTTSGLSVYDGSRFINYSSENGLKANLVNGIVEAGEDSILVIVNVNKLQYIKNGKLQDIPSGNSFCPVINELIKTAAGISYAIADDGLFRFERNRFTKIELKGIATDKNLSHATELDSFLLINTDAVNPAYQFPRNFIVYNYKAGKAFDNTTLPAVYSSIRTPQNEILVSTVKGIFSIDLSLLTKGQIKLTSPSKHYSIPSGSIAYKMYFDKQNNLWISTREGILKIQPSGTRTLFSEKSGLPFRNASCIFQDREGIMWFGNDVYGVAKLVDQSLQFYTEFKPGFFVNNTYIDKHGAVWLYDQAKRCLIMKDLNKKYYTISREPLGDIVIGKTKAYAIGGSSIHQLKFSGERFSVSTIYTRPFDEESFSSLLMDSDDNPIAVGKSVKAILNGKIISVPLDYYADRAVVKNDLLYVATRSMSIYVFRVDPSDTTSYLQLVNYFDKKNDNLAPRSLAIDDSNNLWIGTRYKGLLCFSILNGKIELKKHLTAKDGLTEDFIRLLCYDNSGNLWAATPTGLDKISLNGESISIENVTRASNMYLDIQGIDADKNGVMWVVTSSGLLNVYPSETNNTKTFPQIIVSKFEVNNRDTNLLNKIVLEHYQNNLSFHLGVPTFFDEKKTLYSYKLDETDDEGTWTEPSAQPNISFLNLSPGNYNLRVKAIFSNGKYRPTESSYSFNILRPWWQTGWFRSFIAVTILALVIIFIRLYYRNKLQQQRISLEKKQAIEKERTRIATDMHDDMGAGLSRIKVLSETIKFESQKGIVNPAHLQKISDYSEEMMDKMGEIVWALNEKNDSLNDLLGYTRAYAVEYLTGHDIKCIFEGPSELENVFVSGEVRRNVFLSVKEILHNIIKHAEANVVTISVSHKKEFSISIHDNGKGIDLNYFRKYGNGLNNIRKRMSEVGGSAEFKNENGTSVLLKLSI